MCLRSKSIQPIATASSINGGHTPDRAISEIIDANDFFESNCSPNQWLQVQFNKKVKINSYMMKFPSGWSYCPSNFVLEISLNGTEWKEVDRQNNINFKGKKFLAIII